MVICDRPVARGVPDRVGAHARGRNRVCSGTRTTAPRSVLVKFDLLGLGMLECVARHPSTWCASSTTSRLDIASACRRKDAVYDMVCESDTVGVFQIESRGADGHAAAGLRPRHFYDLVVEIALNPATGPIQGGSVQPFTSDGATARKPVTYLPPRC